MVRGSGNNEIDRIYMRNEIDLNMLEVLFIKGKNISEYANIKKV
jgi:hypothetical protein